MLHTTWRRVNLLPDSFLNSSPLRQFIHSSRCVSGVSVTHFDSRGERPTALRNADAERQPTIPSDSQVSDIFVPKNQTFFQASSSKTSSPDGETKTAKTMTTAKVYTANESAIPKAKPKKPRFVNPPSPKIEAFLRQLESEVDTLTLADVENYRPSEIADTRSSGYEVQYNAAFDRLARSFDMPSMRRIFDLYSIPQLPASLQKKKLYSQAILEYWGWKPASVVKEDMLDETKSSELSFSLSNDEAFLLMGKDGAELLNLAQRYGVSLSFSTDHALSLKAKGFQGSLKRLKGYLNSFKTDIQVENASLHLGQILPFETLKMISRLSGAYITTEDDRLRISFHRSQPRSHEVAKRLAVQAVSRMKTDIAQPVVLKPGNSTSPSFPYSLYPFTPQQQLSWEISSNSSFRLRRIAHWLETIHPTNSSANGELDGIFGSSEANDLISRLSQAINSDISLEIFACTGHFLFLSPSQERKLFPPMIGQHSADDIIQWTQKSPELVTFNYSIPTSMFTYSVNKKQHLRQLVYVEQSNPAIALQLEIAHTLESAEGDTVIDSMGLETRCCISEKISNNILLPDRPTDMQISAARVHNIPIPDLPNELSSFIAATEPAPQPNANAPLLFVLNGIKYALASDERICREFKTISLDGKSINIVTETSTDVDIDQHQAVCKIICKDHSSSESWHEFLNNCDKIATLN